MEDQLELTHDDVEGAAAELAKVMSKLYRQTVRPGDVLDQASAFVAGRSASELALGVASLAAEVRSDADQVGLSFDDLMSAASEGGALELTAEGSAAEVARIAGSERNAVMFAGARQSGPDLEHRMWERGDDPTDDRQPAQGGQAWVDSEVSRLMRVAAGDGAEAPRSGSVRIAPKSRGHRALTI